MRRVALLALIGAVLGLAPGTARADRRDAVERAVGTQRHQRAFQRCYARQLRSGAIEPGAQYLKLVVRLVIGPRGGLRELRVVRETTPDLDACIVSALRRVRFPSTGERVVVSYPFIFG